MYHQTRGGFVKYIMSILILCSSFVVHADEQGILNVKACKEKLEKQIREYYEPRVGQFTVNLSQATVVDESTTHVDGWLYTKSFNIGIQLNFDNKTCEVK